MSRRNDPFECLVRDFLKRFPAQAQFGRRAVERGLRAVLEETDLHPTALQIRVREWSRLRSNMRPWDLKQEPPKPQPKVDLPPDRPEPRLTDATDEAREWAARVTSEWIGEDV